MAFDAKKWLPLGFKLVMQLPAAIGAIEAAKNLFKGGSKEEKKSAAVDATLVGVSLAEDLADKDLLDDANVIAAVENAVDALVAVQNAVAAAKQLKVKQ